MPEGYVSPKKEEKEVTEENESVTQPNKIPGQGKRKILPQDAETDSNIKTKRMYGR
jgi:hypothetical protein